MAEDLELSVARESPAVGQGCVLRILARNPKHAGRKARLRIEQRAIVKRDRPVHGSRVLFGQDLVLRAGENRVALGAALDGCCTYRGEHVELAIEAELKIDDGILFDTKLKLDCSSVADLPQRATVAQDARSVHSPKDEFSFWANLRAVPPQKRAKVLWLCLLGGPILLVNALLGAHDAFQPGAALLYTDPQVGIFGAMGSAVGGCGLWIAIKLQLGQYIRFEAKLPKEPLTRGLRCRAADMISGEAHVPLHNSRVRIVAYNMEHGEYQDKEGSGDNERTVTRSYSAPGRALVLYEQALPQIPAGMPLKKFLRGEVEFTPLFDALYPPQRVSPNHGLSLCVEAQFLHPDLVDHEVVLHPDEVPAAAFYARA